MWRKFVFNITPLKSRRKQLRNRLTETERILWSILQNNGLGYKFIRQYSVEGYVLDFYCPEKKLAIELDGEVHTRNDREKYDIHRTKWLSAYGIKVFRFWNWEIKENLTKVLKEIKQILNT